jgi:lipopolysaccharide transport system permease protein
MERRYWDLTLQLAVRDFKIRYTHSVLGYAWSVLNPLIFFLIYYLVFSVFVRFEAPNYPGYLLLGLVLWSFFAEGSSNGVSSLLARAGLLAKIALPRQVVVYAAILNALMTFGISMVVLAVILRATGMGVSWSMLAFPVLVLDLVVLTLGVALLLSPIHVRYRDVGYLWGIAVQLGFWLTPVIYWERIVPEPWRWLMQYNPMARIIEHSRQAILYGTFPDWAAVTRTTVMVGLILLAGALVFRRLQARVVEYF